MSGDLRPPSPTPTQRTRTSSLTVVVPHDPASPHSPSPPHSHPHGPPHSAHSSSSSPVEPKKSEHHDAEKGAMKGQEATRQHAEGGDLEKGLPPPSQSHDLPPVFDESPTSPTSPITPHTPSHHHAHRPHGKPIQQPSSALPPVSFHTKPRRMSTASQRSRAGHSLHQLEERQPGDVEEVFARGEAEQAEIDREKGDPYLVDWEGEEDPENPKNWNRVYRWFLTMLVAFLTLNASFASSAPSSIIPALMLDLQMSEELGTLTIAIFVVGYCVGPLFWGPLSESYGRRWIFIFAFVPYTIWQVAAALSRTTAQILIFRFLGGTFAAAPVTNAGAVLADIWDADTRGKAMALFTLAPFAGPALGPIVSGYMSVAHVSWRWVFWLLAIFAGACTAAIIFLLPETYTPVLLVQRAKAIRMKTGDPRYFAALEKAGVSLRKRISLVLGRPFKILFLEPMLIAITVYMSFVYGCIYLLFEAFPIVFTQGHGLNAGASGLMFLPLFLGGCAGVALYIWGFNPRYENFMRIYDPLPVPPERRLEMAIVGGPLFAISFFWFGWTSFDWISYWSPMMATFPLGIGITLIFLSLFNYIIDAYLMVAASALASSTVVRSSFGAGFPMFATQMFQKLNPRWASTLLGCIACLLIPIPLVLMKYGAHLRRKSKYAPTT